MICNYQTHAKIILLFSTIIGVTYWAETTLDREFTVSSDGAGAVFLFASPAFNLHTKEFNILIGLVDCVQYWYTVWLHNVTCCSSWPD